MSEPLQRRLVRSDEPRAEEVRALVVLVAERLRGRSAELSDSMNAAIESAVEYLDDAELAGMLHASVEGNVSQILNMLVNDIPLEHGQPITAASEYAVRLARADVPGTALRRAYHIGSDDLLSEMFEEIQRLDADADLKLLLLHHLAGWMHRYVDWISRVVVEVHEAERQRLAQRSATDVSRLVHRLVQGDDVDPGRFARTTGHRLSQRHRAAVLWVEGVSQGVDRTEALEALSRPLGAALGAVARPLFTPVDRSTAWMWVGLGTSSGEVDVERVREVLADHPDVRVALGAVGEGVAGFRQSLEQAGSVRGVARVGPTRRTQVVGYGEDGMAVVAMLVRDLPAARRWVREALGGLAADTEAADRLRETTRIYLRTGSATETSELLLLHRNTVKYRLGRAEAERGRPFTQERLDLELALHACHLLGAAVLDGAADATEDD